MAAGTPDVSTVGDEPGADDVGSAGELGAPPVAPGFEAEAQPATASTVTMATVANEARSIVQSYSRLGDSAPDGGLSAGGDDQGRPSSRLLEQGHPP